MTESGHAYRPDIDGLRAIAVGSVVLFHAFPWLVPGGYVGVDVFFVISGFLITTNILSGLESRTFTIGGFYDRRVRRIFPALVTVLLATYLLGWISLFATEFRQLGKHIAGGSFFVSNLILRRESGYFDTASEVKPLVHLWSLGIEEQFYIVWPLLLWAMYRFARRVIAPTLVLIIVSFVLGLASIDGVGGYYSPINRFWELLIGALLAMITIHGTHVPNRARSTFATLGMVAIVGPMFALDAGSQFPGFNAMAPTLGAALVIAAQADNWWARRVLSLRGMVWIGLVSYPLYLWHWPLLTYARIISSGVPSAAVRTGAVLLAVVLSYATYRLIERPLRFHRSRRRVVAGLVVSMAVIGAIGVVAFERDGFPGREFNRVNVAPDPSAARDIDQISTIGCGLDAATQELFADCRTDVRGRPTYALIGDSKASALIGGFMRTSVGDRWWTILGGTKGIQSAVPLISSEPAYERFQDLIVPAVDTVIANPEIRVVVLQGAVRAMFEWPDFTNFAWLSGDPNYDKVETALHETVRRLVEGGKKVVLYVDNPALAAPEDCAGRRTTIGLLNALLVESNPECRVALDTFLADTAKYRALLDRIAEQFPDSVSVFDPTPDLCDVEARTCGHVKDGVSLYSYTDHPSDDAAELIGRRLNAYLAAL